MRLLATSFVTLTFFITIHSAQTKADDAKHYILSGNFMQQCAALHEKKIYNWQYYYCLGFLHGMQGGLRAEREKPMEICLPKGGPSANKFYPALSEYLAEHPEEATHKSRSVVFNTLKDKFPCMLN